MYFIWTNVLLVERLFLDDHLPFFNHSHLSLCPVNVSCPSDSNCFSSSLSGPLSSSLSATCSRQIYTLPTYLNSYLSPLQMKYIYLRNLPFRLFPLSSLCCRIFVVGIGFFSLCFLMTSLGGQFSAKRLGDAPFTIRTEGMF